MQRKSLNGWDHRSSIDRPYEDPPSASRLRVLKQRKQEQRFRQRMIAALAVFIYITTFTGGYRLAKAWNDPTVPAAPVKSAVTVKTQAAPVTSGAVAARPIKILLLGSDPARR